MTLVDSDGGKGYNLLKKKCVELIVGHADDWHRIDDDPCIPPIPTLMFLLLLQIRVPADDQKPEVSDVHRSESVFQVDAA